MYHFFYMFNTQSRTVAPPTMSVEEWGKIEMEQAMKRQDEVRISFQCFYYG